MCGADIEKIEEDENLQSLVDRFIEGHARIKRTQVDNNDEADKNKKVVYEDVSLERGSFLVQQAMRVCCFLPFLNCKFFVQWFYISVLCFPVCIIQFEHVLVHLINRHFVPRI